MDRSHGDLVDLNCHVVLNRPIALNHHIVLNSHVVLNRPLWRPHPSASFWGLASSLKARAAVIVPGRSSSVPGLSLGLVVIRQPLFL